MNNYPSFAIVLSFIGLWITSFISAEIQVIVGFVMILSFGILHGANDILISNSLVKNKKKFSIIRIILFYLIIVLSGALFFYFLPTLTLFLFVLISGYHFGEQQFNEVEEFKNSNFIFKTLYGLLVLFLLFGFHVNEVIDVVYEITSYKISSSLILNSLYIILVLFIFKIIILFLNAKTDKNFILKELFYLIVYSIIFKVSALIWSFSIYFIVWHSVPSIMNQTKFLYGSFNSLNFIKYIKDALLYWVMSIIGLLLFYFLFRDVKLFNTLFFSFLAAITFPHVFVILNMFNDKSKT